MVIQPLSLLIFVLLLWAQQQDVLAQQNTAQAHCEDTCASQDEQPYVMMATKTAYQLVFGKRSDQHKVPDCRPVQFWSLNRHGTSYPSVKTLDRLRALNRIRDLVVDNYENQRSFPDCGALCSSDYNFLKRWRWNETIDANRAGGLTPQGAIDVKYLARRYVSRFDQLLRSPYDTDVYSFQYTGTDRTHDSYQAYIEGLFRNEAYRVHANLVGNNEKLIKPTESCPFWETQIDNNEEILTEQKKFQKSELYQQMVTDVFRRLGFLYTPNETLIKDMYDACRLEKAWNLNAHSPWCGVFTQAQLKLLEYEQDLKYFYKNGYGSDEVARNVACPLVRDLYERFAATINGTAGPNRVAVFFTHSVTIQTFLTAMGIAQDSQFLTADNYAQQDHRQWRTSTISPFAANLVAVLYRCHLGDYKVMFFLNEIPVEYSDCSVGLCNWQTVRNRLHTIAENCNIDAYCARGAAISYPHNKYVICYYVLTSLLFYFVVLTK